MVKEEYVGHKREKKTLIEVADFLISKFENKVTKGLRSEQSLSKWRTVRSKIKQFLKFEYKTENILLSKINYCFAGDFVDYLTTEQSINTNSAFKYCKQVKQLLKLAVERGWLPINPIQGFRSTYRQPDRDILDSKELLQLYNKEFSTPDWRK